MATLQGFNTWDDVANYIENTMGISYTESPTEWVDAMYELTKGYKYVEVINDVTGEATTQLVSEQLVSGVGEVHTVPGNGSSWYHGGSGNNSSVSGGGAKSVPTGKSIITNTTTETAVATDPAVGVKDVGTLTLPKTLNVVSGLLQCYGLIHTGINIVNSKVWKDMCNAIFDTDFTDDTPIDVLKRFIETKLNVLVSVDNDDLTTYIPEDIAEKMYNFLASHMTDTGEPILEPSFNSFGNVYRWINRHFDTTDPTTYTFDRYLSTSNPNDSAVIKAATISDDLFKSFAQDYITQLIASGFTVPSNVGDALVNSLSGICEKLDSYMTRPTTIYDCNVINVQFNTLSGRTSVPQDVPIALSEIRFSISCKWDNYIQIDPTTHLLTTNFNTYNGNISSYLASGESFVNGDCIKYKKRNKTGASDNDYGYTFVCDNSGSSSNRVTLFGVDVTYPSNEMALNSYWYNASTTLTCSSNGFVEGDILQVGVPNWFYKVDYSNIGMFGNGSYYEPDDYLVTAGFKRRAEDKCPDPTKTREDQYPTQAQQKKEVANASRRVESGTVYVDNNIVGYVPTSVPFGGNNFNQLIDHGMNNPDDPDSYNDNRVQNTILSGSVNRSDPTDGFNEDTDSAVDQYNQSTYDPDHYPEPVPENEYNPQYPTNPPADTTGDTGDTPTPATMQGVTASGMCSVYNPTKQEIIDFSAWLWSPSFFDNFLKIFANPMDAIIGLHIMYATPVTTTPSNIIVGYLDSGVSAKVVSQQYIDVDCGSVTVPEYYGTVLDYEPYTTVHMYLPFVGIVSLKANDVIGKQVNVSYGVDVLTGTCLARITTKKGDSDICCYTFPGNCSVQVPLSGGNYAQVLRSIASVAVGVAGSVLTANPLPAIGGVVAGAMGSSLDVSHSGSIGSNAGAMGIRKPYIILTRRVGYEASKYNQFYGYPANKTVTLGACTGFTRIKSVHIDSIAVATDTEKSEIETLLKQGIIIK